MANPRPPVGVGREARRFWAHVLADYDLTAPELEILRQAVVIVDQLARADATLRESPDLLAEGSMGQIRPHPLLASTVELRKVLDSLLRSLAFPFPSEDEGRRRSPSAQAAANARWRR
jgi:hypothetical protein